MIEGLAARMAEISSFQVMSLLARSRELEAQGKRIIHMEIGEPDFSTPEPIVAAGIRALAAGRTHYTPATGLPELRAAVANYYQTRYGQKVNADQVVITPGSSGALLLALGALLNPDDQVLMADPGYPCNRNFVRFLNGEPISIGVDATTQFQLTDDLLAHHWQPTTKAVIVASPTNPVGSVLPAKPLANIAKAVRQRGGYLIVDEIYHGLEYTDKLPTILSIDEQAFVVNSFSKYFGMTGWRLGWLIAPKQFVPAIERLAQNIFLAPSTPGQYAALAAFDESTMRILQQRRDEFRQRRDYLVPALQALGFTIPCLPQGAFYIYANCSRFTDNSFDFCHRLLEEVGVAVTPGSDFGDRQAAQHIRFAYTTNEENLREGVRRLTKHLASIKQ